MKRYPLVLAALLLLAAAGVVGCGAVPTGAPPPAATATAGPREIKTVEAGSGPATPTPAPAREEATMIPTSAAQTAVTPPPEAEAAIRLARADLAKRLDVLPEAIRLVSAEAVDWPDTSLGCPQPGEIYAQVITPGFLVTMEGQGEEYAYHTDRGEQIVLCQAQKSLTEPAIPISPPPAPGAEAAVRLAVEDLAKRLGVAPEAIRLVSAEAVEWSDASLGCPQPGMMYAQVITPGFLVVLEAGGKRYEYHTDEGRFVVMCAEGKGSGVAPSKGLDATLKDGSPNQPIKGGSVDTSRVTPIAPR